MNLRRLVPSAVTSLLLCGWLVSLPAGGQSVRSRGSESAEAGAEGENRAQEQRDDVRRREEWFYRQRRYPLSAIPGRARLDALERKEEMRRALGKKLRAAAAARRRAEEANGATSPTANSQANVTSWTAIGPMPTVSSGGGVGVVSGRVTAIAVDPTNSNIVYLGGAQGGVWKSTDGGTNWATTFDTEKTLAIGAIAIDPSSCVPGPCTTLYIGTGEQNFSGDSYYGAGIYKSTDGGATWSQTAGTVLNVPRIPSFIGPFNQTVGGVRVSAIVVHPTNAMRIFAGVQIFENVGGGATSGLYCSDDGGNSWERVISGAIGTDVAIHPGGVTGYAALGSNTGDTASGDPTGQNGVYKSSGVNLPCANETWTLVSGAPLPLGTAAGTIRLGLAPSDATANTLYAAVANPESTTPPYNTTLAGVFKSVDGGASWTTVTPPLAGSPAVSFCDPQCDYDMAIKVHPTDAQTVIVGGSRTFKGSQPFFLLRTNNAGASWQSIATDGVNTLHVDQHAIAFGFNGANVTTLFVGNDGGIWSSPLATSSSPVSWTNLNQTLQLSQFYPGISIDPTTPDTAFGGTQDNGTQKYDLAANPPNQWVEQAPCGDGGYTAIDPASPSTIYAACQNIDIRRSLNGGADGFPDSADSGINQNDRVEFIAPLVIDPHPATSNQLYFGTYRVWQTMNRGANWSAISPDLTGGGASLPTIESLSVSPVDGDVLYAGTFDSKVWRTTNASAGTGATWSELDGGTLPPRAVTQVVADPNHQDVVFVTLSGFSGFVINPPNTDTKGHVFRCSATLLTCADVSGTAAGALPNIPVNALVVDPLDPGSDTLYIGTDVGVFATTDGGVTWLPDFPATPPAQNGLPNVAVLSLALQPAARILRAGTHGRGAWDLQLALPPPPTLTSISPASGAQGQSLSVTLTGTNFATGSTINVPAGEGIIITGVSVTDSTTITATLQISPTATLGAQNISVTTVSGTSPAQTFLVNLPVPTITSLSPNNGVLGTSPTVTITGTGFGATAAQTTLTFAGTGANVPYSNLTVVNNTTITATVAIPASAASAGPVTVAVTTPGGTSGTATFTAGSNFTLMASSLSGSVMPGGSAMATLTVTPTTAGAGSFPAAVTITCSGQPDLTTCSAPSIAAAATMAPGNTSTLTIQTAAPSFLLPRLPDATRGISPRGLVVLAWAGAVLLAAGIFAARRAPRMRRFAVGCALAMLLALASLVEACGGGSGEGGGGSAGTNPGTYHITVTASSGSATPQTVTFTLTVQ